MENYEERLRGFIEREQTEAALQFLQGLEEQERKKFAPFLKTICKEYLELHDTGKGWRTKANDKQTALIGSLLFVCSPRNEFERRAYIWSVTPKRITEILEWHQPSWFGDYVNSLGSDGFVPPSVTYDWILDLESKGFITPSREIIARTLARYVFEELATRQWVAKPEKLFDHDVTLKEHIWYFFDTGNFIYQADREDQWGSRSEENRTVWGNILRDLAASGKLERIKLLNESVLATSRNFNKLLTAWHVDLFISLEATKEELLQIQSSLFNALNSNHSKAVNAILTAMKKIVDQEAFSSTAFIEHIPLLLSSEAKSIVTSTLSIIDKIAKKGKEQRTALCLATSQVFISPDADLQKKAATLIEKYQGNSQEEIKKALAPYEHSILANAREILSTLLATDVTSRVMIDQSLPVQKIQRAELNGVHSFDELLFLASQAFDYNQTYHIDLLPAAIVEWNHKIKPDQVPMFEPALQRALKMALEGVGSTGGSLEYLLCLFFIDYCRTLIAQHPVHGQSLTDLYITYTRKDHAAWGKRIIPLSDWKAGRGGEIFNPIIDILLAAHEKAITNDQLPLLSTPTHEPCYIAPDVLLARLKKYNDAGREPNLVDFQVAVSRCDLGHAADAVSFAKENLTGELRQLMLFLFDKSNQSIEILKYPAVWIAASLSKDNTAWPVQFDELTGYSSNKFLAQDPWRVFLEPYHQNQYDHNTKKTERITLTRKRLEIQYDRRRIPQKEGKFKDLFIKLAGMAASRKGCSTIYDTIDIKADFNWVDRHDIARLFYLTPNNPEPMFAEVLNVALRESTLDARQQQILSNALEAILPLGFTYRKMGHLFIAASMLTGDKTVQTFAAELWAKGVTEGTLSSTKLGGDIGAIQSIEFAPLKRFSDLVAASLINRSQLHNQELEKLLTEVIARLPLVPPTNLKKLLELYYEVLSINRSKSAERLSAKFAAWRSSAGLKKILESLK